MEYLEVRHSEHIEKALELFHELEFSRVKELLKRMGEPHERIPSKMPPEIHQDHVLIAIRSQITRIYELSIPISICIKETKVPD